MKRKITLVTGLWDMGRDRLGNDFKRSYSSYLEKFRQLINSIPDEYGVVIYNEGDLRIGSGRQNVQYVDKPLESFKNWFSFYKEVGKIRSDEDWYSQAEWLKQSPQAQLEYYNPVVMSKMFMLHDAKISNPFNSEFIYWIDAGLCNTVDCETYIKKERLLDKLAAQDERFTFVCYPYETSSEIHGFKKDAIDRYAGCDVRYVARGGFFGGHIDSIKWANSHYYKLLENTLKDGYMGTEESIFSIMCHQSPNNYNRKFIEGDGLVYKFFEDLKKSPDLIKNCQIHTDQGVSLYVTSFNSPKQFLILIESFSYQKEFLSKTNKFLVNSSFNDSFSDEYKKICEEYGFSYIEKLDIGICGARQFIAEHFQSSSSSFYISFEDDMLFSLQDGFDNYGFRRRIDNLYEISLYIMEHEGYDYLKLNFQELYGNNNKQWAWFNLPTDKREFYWPEIPAPRFSGDPNCPNLPMRKISSYKGVSYAEGDIYYCNWPMFFSREGNQKVFLDTIWKNPYEQTWMSHNYLLQKEGKIRCAVLLASPISHLRTYYYDGRKRKEN